MNEELMTKERLEQYVQEVVESASRFDYPWDEKAVDWPSLGSDSVVIEVGGFKGRWALQIANKYSPRRLYVYEPQAWAYEVCQAVLGERALVGRFALGTRDCMASMDKWGTDGCTLMNADGWSPDIMIKEIGAWFVKMDTCQPDLMLMNIEGYEYELIPHMMSRGVYPQRLMVQFHTFADLSGVETGRIYELLAKNGYQVLWTYGTVLTAWERGRQ